MKPIYKSLLIEAAILSVSLSLQAQVTSGETVATQDVQAESLEGLKVVLISPNVSGAKDLIASGECVLDGANININLQNLAQGIHRVQVSAVFGTQTCVIYALDLTVPTGALATDEPQEFEDEVTVVSTFGDGDKSGADATVYAKDGDGNAHITKPLSIGSGVATSDGAVASGYTEGGASIQATSAGAVASGYAEGEGASIQATSDGAVASGCAGEGASIQAGGDGAVASGYADEGASIQAGGDGAVASGSAYGEGTSIQANYDGAVAIGRAYGEGASIQAGGDGAVAIGRADEGASIQAGGDGAVASGYADETKGNVEASGMASQAFGIGVKATQDAQMVVGECNVEDEDGSFQFIVGNGTDNENRHNAFAVTKSGELALFEADGTPVILTAADLKALIALL